MIISVDAGQANLKATNGVKNFKILNTFLEGEKFDGGYQIEFEDNKYVIGDVTGQYEYETSKKTFPKKLAFYLAIAKLTEYGDSVDVIVGCPLDIFVNKKLRKEFEEYLFARRVDLVVDGKEHCFLINKITAVPESSGIIYSNHAKFDGKLVGVVDIGGLNCNCSIYSDLVIDRSYSFTNKLGINILHNSIRDAIKKSGCEINLEEIAYEIKNEDSKHKEIIDKVMKKHVRDIKKDLQRHGWTDNMTLFFTGGGSLVLEEHLFNQFDIKSLSSDPVMDNVKGFQTIGLERYGKK